MKLSVTLLAMSLSVFGIKGTCQSSENKAAWEVAKTIREKIVEPTFRDKVYAITDFGAVAGGKIKNTRAIDAAITKCNQEGGGQVLITNGKFLTGPIHMKSNVNLHIDSTAVLLFSTEPADYLPLVRTRWEGDDCYNYSPLIYADGQSNFAITGKGLLDGQAGKDNWWPWKGGTSNGWIKGTPSQLDSKNRPQFISFIHCKIVKLENFTITNSPFWVLHPLLSENVIVRGVTVNSEGPNNDGCDPESCKNVLIENCTFNTGDDCIALKSGRDFDGRRENAPIENVIIRNCFMRKGHGGVSMGSEISGGCKNIFVENCQMSSPELDRAILIKTNNSRGGVTDGVYVRNVVVGEVKDAILSINCSYHIDKEGEGKFPPMIKNVFLTNVTSKKSAYAIWLDGINGKQCVDNINVENCVFSGVEQKNQIKNIGKVTLKNVIMNGEVIRSEE